MPQPAPRTPPPPPLPPTPPTLEQLLRPDETIMNPHYMKQLLKYGIQLGLQHMSELPEEKLESEAQVGVLCDTYMLCATGVLTSWTAQRLIGELQMLHHAR